MHIIHFKRQNSLLSLEIILYTAPANKMWKFIKNLLIQENVA